MLQYSQESFELGFVKDSEREIFFIFEVYKRETGKRSIKHSANNVF